MYKNSPTGVFLIKKDMLGGCVWRWGRSKRKGSSSLSAASCSIYPTFAHPLHGISDVFVCYFLSFLIELILLYWYACEQLRTIFSFRSSIQSQYQSNLILIWNTIRRKVAGRGNWSWEMIGEKRAKCPPGSHPHSSIPNCPLSRQHFCHFKRAFGLLLYMVACS